MKIAITGHSQGLGLALASLFHDLGHVVVGLSRSNGYDINDTERIVEVVKDCDVFINNAYDGTNQTILLNQLFACWTGTNKIIINIGSAVTAYPRLEQDRDNEPWPYREHKQDLEKTFRHLSKLPHTCQMQLISPGAIDTKMIAHLDCPKMTAKQVALAIWHTMCDPLIKELVLYE
jgi:nucleoside-diphosphate-sugar epimerase